MATSGAGRGRGPERAWVDPLPSEGAVTLTEHESSHLVRSRRVGEGDAVVLFDGRGTSVLGRLVRADPRGARVEVVEAYPDREPARRVRLAVSPPEGGRADALVSQLAQLGVDRVQLLLTDRTPPGRADQAQRRQKRWARLAIEAAKVNGRSRCLQVTEYAMRLETFLEAHGKDAILLDPDPALPALPAILPPEDPFPWLLVGPEGGFTAAELDAADVAGARRARLGSTALRTETAALAAASILSVLA